MVVVVVAAAVSAVDGGGGGGGGGGAVAYAPATTLTFPLLVLVVVACWSSGDKRLIVYECRARCLHHYGLEGPPSAIFNSRVNLLHLSVKF